MVSAHLLTVTTQSKKPRATFYVHVHIHVYEQLEYWRCVTGVRVEQLRGVLKEHLMNIGIDEGTIEILQEEMVMTMDIFIVLKEEHFERLLPKVKVGQHAQLLKLWEDLQV